MSYTYYGWSLRNEWIECGKDGCTSCPHGPYWYGYRKDGTRMKKKYFGKERPKEWNEQFKEYRTEAVVDLCKCYLSEKNPDTLAILADALSEAGYDNSDLLKVFRNCPVANYSLAVFVAIIIHVEPPERKDWP